jgi:acyl carrier protein/pimeloyl-ACP methyl ester carboxylesterase
VIFIVLAARSADVVIRSVTSSTPLNGPCSDRLSAVVCSWRVARRLGVVFGDLRAEDRLSVLCRVECHGLFFLTPLGFDQVKLAPDRADDQAGLGEIQMHPIDIEGPILEYLGQLLELDVTSMSIDDDFFDLGGTSVQCLDLFMWIEERFGVDLPLSTITHAPTVRLLAGIVNDDLEGHRDGASKDVPFPEQWEWVLCILWSEILNVPEVKPSDNFFDLGGNDDDVQKLTDQLRDIYGMKVTSFDVKRAPTVIQLAALTRGHSTRSCLVPLTVTGSKTPFFCVAGLAGLALAFLPVARGLGSDRPFYGLQAHGIDRRGRPDYTIKGTARRYVKEIRSVQAHGPYLIGGHSYGGLIALEVVHQLVAQGEEVALMVVFDSIIPQRLVNAIGADLERVTGSTNTKWLPYQPAIRLGTIVRLPVAGLIRLRGFNQYEAYGLIGRIQVRLAKPLRPWSGSSVVYISANNPYEADILGSWGRLLTGAWSRVAASGSHLGMMQRPHARMLAQSLKEQFAEALEASAAQIPSAADE